MSDLSELPGRIIAVTDRKSCARPLLEQVERLCALRPYALILREKDLDGVAYRALAEEVLGICARHAVPCMLHAHMDAVGGLPAAGIHLPLTELRRTPAVRLAPFGELGASVHSLAEALEAQRLKASYLVAGHVYDTACKPGLPARGLGFLREVCAAVDLPVYAIGGVGLDASRLREVVACGARGACAMSAAMRL